MIAVAVDEDVETIRGAADGITYPILIDADHVVTELYAISNVPTVLMIDEDDNIVQPNWSAYASDTFRELTGINSETQMDHIRAWAKEGTLRMSPEDAKGAVHDLSSEEEQARCRGRRTELCHGNRSRASRLDCAACGPAVTWHQPVRRRIHGAVHRLQRSRTAVPWSHRPLETVRIPPRR